MLKALTWEDLCTVARSMRTDHARSACALAGTDDPLEAIGWLEHARHVGVTIWRDGKPVVAAGAVLQHPGVCSTFMYATDDWPKVVIETTRFFNQGLRAALIAAGVHRVNTLAMAGDPMTDRWKRFFGCGPEATLRRYGKNGEDFVLFVNHLQPPGRWGKL